MDGVRGNQARDFTPATQDQFPHEFTDLFASLVQKTPNGKTPPTNDKSGANGRSGKADKNPDAKGPNGSPSAKLHGTSNFSVQYSSDTTANDPTVAHFLNSLGNAVSPQDKASLAQISNDLQIVKNWADNHVVGEWGATGIRLNDAPPRVKAALQQLLANEPMRKQLPVVNGVIFSSSFDKLSESFDADISAAEKSWQSFQSTPGNTDPEARKRAAAAALLQAYYPMIDHSPADGLIDRKDLQEVAADKGEPDALRKAAALIANPKIFHWIEIADPGNIGGGKQDGLANFDNLGAWISSGAQISRGATPNSDGDQSISQAVKSYVNALGDNISPSERQSLLQNAHDLQIVQNYAEHSYGPWGGSIVYPNEAPAPVKAVLNRLLSQESLKKQLALGGSFDGGPRGIPGDEINELASKFSNAASAAQKSWDEFENGPGSNDPTARRMAADASILEANLPLLDGAASGSKIDGTFGVKDLEAVANGDAGSVSPALQHAAALFANKGVFGLIDMAGGNPVTTKPDGLADDSNLSYWIQNDAKSFTAPKMLEVLSSAAYQNLSSQADLSKLGPDVFKHPGDYTGAQKAAVLQQLEQLKAQIQAGAKQGFWVDTVNSGLAGALANAGISPQEGPDMRELNARINQLQSDPDVNNYLSKNINGSLQSIVGADPGLRASLQAYYKQSVESGDMLKEDIKNEGPEKGLQTFFSQASTMAKALGVNGNALKTNFPEIAQKAGVEGELQKLYQSKYLNGSALKDAIKNGTDLSTAIKDFTSTAADLELMLPPKYVASHAGEMQQNYANALNDSLTNIGTKGDLEEVYGDANGNLDTAKLKAAITQAEKQDPKDFEDAQGNLIPVDKLVASFRYAFDQVRQGAKFNDALYKLANNQYKTELKQWKANGEVGKAPVEPKKPSGGFAKAYGTGMLHAVSALLNTGVLVARGLEGEGSSATGTAGMIANGAQVVRGLMEAGAKYRNSVNPYPKGSDPYKAYEAQYKNIETAGKALGGAAGAAAGALSIFGGVEALDSGDKVEGGVDIATGITNVLSGVAGLTEAGLAAFGAADSIVAGAAGASSILGIASAGVGLLAEWGLSIYEVVELGNEGDTWRGDVVSGLSKWGITGGGPEKNPAEPDGGVTQPP